MGFAACFGQKGGGAAHRIRRSTRRARPNYEICNGYRAKCATRRPIGDGATSLQAVFEQCRYEIRNKTALLLKGLNVGKCWD